ADLPDRRLQFAGPRYDAERDQADRGARRAAQQDGSDRPGGDARRRRDPLYRQARDLADFLTRAQPGSSLEPIGSSPAKRGEEPCAARWRGRASAPFLAPSGSHRSPPPPQAGEEPALT